MAARAGTSRSSASTWSLTAICAYAMLIPLQPVLMMPDGSPLRFAAADAVEPLVFLFALARPRRRLPGGLACLVVALPLLALFSTLWAARERELSHYALGKTAGLFYLVGLCFAVARSLEEDASAAVLRALGRGAVWSAIVGLIALAAAWRGIVTPLIWNGRLCSTMLGDANIYCSLLAVGSLAVAADRSAPVSRRLARLLVLALAVLATGSRSGIMALAAGLAVWALVQSRDVWVTGARALYVLGVAAFVGVLLVSSGPGASAASALWEHVWRTFTVESRFVLYARALQQFGEHAFMGLGIGGFNDLNAFELGGEHSPVHNTYLWALVDLGIGGGFLVSALIVAAIAVAVRAARQPRTREDAAVVAAGLAAMSVFNLFVDGLYQRHFWVLMACALGMSRARRPLAQAWQQTRHPRASLAYPVPR